MAVCKQHARLSSTKRCTGPIPTYAPEPKGDPDEILARFVHGLRAMAYLTAVRGVQERRQSDVDALHAGLEEPVRLLVRRTVGELFDTGLPGVAIFLRVRDAKRHALTI